MPEQSLQVTEVFDVRMKHVPELVLLLGFQTGEDIVKLKLSPDDAQDLVDKLALKGIAAR